MIPRLLCLIFGHWVKSKIYTGNEGEPVRWEQREFCLMCDKSNSNYKENK